MPTNRPTPKPSFRGAASSLLMKAEMDKLLSLGIIASPLVTEQFQERAKRWVLNAKEAGGSLGAHGYHVGIAAAGEAPALLSLPINTFAPNQVHRTVVGTDLVTVEMYRYITTCSLSIVRHTITTRENGTPSTIAIELMRGAQGLLEVDARDPLFYDESGELVLIPSHLTPLVRAAAKAVRCDGCRHSHFMTIPPLMLEPLGDSPRSVDSALVVPTVAPVAVPGTQTQSRKSRATPSSTTTHAATLQSVQ